MKDSKKPRALVSYFLENSLNRFTFPKVDEPCHIISDFLFFLIYRVTLDIKAVS